MCHDFWCILFHRVGFWQLAKLFTHPKRYFIGNPWISGIFGLGNHHDSAVGAVVMWWDLWSCGFLEWMFFSKDLFFQLKRLPFTQNHQNSMCFQYVHAHKSVSSCPEFIGKTLLQHWPLTSLFCQARSPERPPSMLLGFSRVDALIGFCEGFYTTPCFKLDSRWF